MDPISRSDEAWLGDAENLSFRRKSDEEQRAKAESSMVSAARASRGSPPSEHERVRAIIHSVEWYETRKALEPNEEAKEQAINELRRELRVYGLPDELSRLKVWLQERGQFPAHDTSWEMAELAFNVQWGFVRSQRSSDVPPDSDVLEWAKDIVMDRELSSQNKNTKHSERAALYRRIDQRKRDNPKKSAQAELVADKLLRDRSAPKA